MATSTEEIREQLDDVSIRKYYLEILYFILWENLEGTIVYTSEKNGNDENGDGSEGKPFKTPLKVFIKKNRKFL